MSVVTDLLKASISPDGLVGKVITSGARHAVTAGGVWLVGQGYLANDQQSAFLGAVMTLVGLALAGADKVLNHKPNTPEQPPI